VQAYLDRWQIEVLHRDLKNGIGVGQVQAWNEKSNDKVHGAQVATYSMLNLASLRTFGGRRTDDFPELPLWRKRKPHAGQVNMTLSPSFGMTCFVMEGWPPQRDLSQGFPSGGH
jgi:hypothetical protein